MNMQTRYNELRMYAKVMEVRVKSSGENLLVAEILKLENPTGPSNWFIVEMNKYREVSAIKEFDTR